MRFIAIGGFLGAGKTTLMAEAARRLAHRGRKVGLITNDQAPDLVDTNLLAGQGFAVQEVAGSCFCCNFNALIGAAARLQQQLPVDTLLAEPVGSCTDLSATILQPLKDKYGDAFSVAPLSVLADPHRLKEILSGTPSLLHRDAAYIFLKQLEEADVVVINKSDLICEAEREALAELVAPAAPVARHCFVSALTGEGVDAWLDWVLAPAPAGRHIPEVDYEVYANGEAVLGWFNASYELTATSPQSWDEFCGRVIGELGIAVARAAIEVGHIKLLLTTASGEWMGNITRCAGPTLVRDQLKGPTREARLVVNAHIQTSPQKLERIAERALRAAASPQIVIRTDRLHSLQPGRPVPTHRYAHVVS